MKKLILVIAIIGVIISSAALTGCVKVNLAEKNGPLTTQSYDFTDFTGIAIGNAFELVVTPSDNYSVSITAGENMLDNIKVRKDGSTLVFEMDGWTDIWFSSWYSSPKVNITMPALSLLKLSGAAKATVTGFQSNNDFNLELSGASHINLDMVTGDFTAEFSGASDASGKLTAQDLYIVLSGASNIAFTGSGNNIRIKGSGASVAKLADFSVNDADIRFSGASHISLEVNGRMDVELSGASSLEYGGDPDLGHIDTSGASNMDRKDTN
jgi:hypothetical protein